MLYLYGVIHCPCSKPLAVPSFIPTETAAQLSGGVLGIESAHCRRLHHEGIPKGFTLWPPVPSILAHCAAVSCLYPRQLRMPSFTACWKTRPN